MKDLLDFVVYRFFFVSRVIRNTILSLLLLGKIACRLCLFQIGACCHQHDYYTRDRH